MKKKIETTGQLRQFLVDMMVGVKDGLVDSEDARNMTKLAAQVNESFYSEIKVQKLRKELAGEEFSALGSTPIGEKEPSEAA